VLLQAILSVGYWFRKKTSNSGSWVSRCLGHAKAVMPRACDAKKAAFLERERASGQEK